MRGELPKWADYGLLPLVNLSVALLAAGLATLMIGENPLRAALLLIDGAFGSGHGIGYTLFYATNFIFAGLAVAVAFHAGLFNIGGEGQAYIGGLGAALICLSFDRYLPWPILLALAVASTALFGAAWAFLPALLQAKRGSHIVITTIMFNFIASAAMVYLLTGPLIRSEQLGPRTRDFEQAAHLPRLDSAFASAGIDIGAAPLNLSFLLALIMAAIVWAVVWRTRFGYELRAFGHSPSAARYAGIGAAKITILAMSASGALAGIMALNPVMGDQTRLQLDFTEGAGFVGIAVALMGRAHPAGIVLAAILFGALYQGGAELAFDMPGITRDMIVLIQGLAILFAGALEGMFRPSLTRLLAPGPQGARAS